MERDRKKNTRGGEEEKEILATRDLISGTLDTCVSSIHS